MLVRVIAIATCLSVRLSVGHTPVLCQNEEIMISTPSGSPTIRVFWCQISLQNSKGLPQSGRLKQGWNGKTQGFSSFKRQYLENGTR